MAAPKLSDQTVPGVTGGQYPGVPDNLEEHSTWDLQVLADGRGLNSEDYDGDRDKLIKAIKGTV